MTRGTIDTFRKLSTYFFPISKQSCPMPWDQIRIKSQCVYSRQWRLSNLIPPEVKVHRHSSHCPNDGTITKQFFALQFYSDNSKFIFLASGPNFCAFRVRATQRALKSMHVISATTMWHSVEFFQFCILFCYWADDKQTSWIIALWWLSVSLWRICITFLWPSTIFCIDKTVPGTKPPGGYNQDSCR